MSPKQQLYANAHKVWKDCNELCMNAFQRYGPGSKTYKDLHVRRLQLLAEKASLAEAVLTEILNADKN